MGRSNGKRWDRQWAIKKIADFNDSKEEDVQASLGVGKNRNKGNKATGPQDRRAPFRLFSASRNSLVTRQPGLRIIHSGERLVRCQRVSQRCLFLLFVPLRSIHHGKVIQKSCIFRRRCHSSLPRLAGQFILPNSRGTPIPAFPALAPSWAPLLQLSSHNPPPRPPLRVHHRDPRQIVQRHHIWINLRRLPVRILRQVRVPPLLFRHSHFQSTASTFPGLWHDLPSTES